MKTNLEILQYHQAWRRGDEDAMIYSAKEIGIAIDDAISALRERPVARASAVMMAGEIELHREWLGIKSVLNHIEDVRGMVKNPLGMV